MGSSVSTVQEPPAQAILTVSLYGGANEVSLYSRMRIIYTQNEQDNQAISTDRLHALQRFDPRPIDVVVFHGLNGDTLF